MPLPTSLAVPSPSLIGHTVSGPTSSGCAKAARSDFHRVNPPHPYLGLTFLCHFHSLGSGLAGNWTRALTPKKGAIARTTTRLDWWWCPRPPDERRQQGTPLHPTPPNPLAHHQRAAARSERPRGRGKPFDQTLVGKTRRPAAAASLVRRRMTGPTSSICCSACMCSSSWGRLGREGINVALRNDGPS